MKLLPTLIFVVVSMNFLFSQQNDNIKIKNVEQINTAALEFAPVYYHHGLVYVSSDSRQGKMDKSINEKTFDLKYADLGPKSKLSKPNPFSLKVNTRYHEGSLSFSPDMNKMYFTRSNVKNGVPIKARDGIVKLKIYEATKGKEDWEKFKELPFNSDQFSCIHPTVSRDGQYMYFASDRPEGEGGMDLYYVKRIGDRWSEPVNLGPEINTPGQEVFPYIHPTGKLFFSSNRQGTMGGLDIYTADFTEKVTGKVIPLPAPINSSKDDLGLILSVSGEVGFFSSDRPGGKGKDDVYRLDIMGGFKGLFPPKDFDKMVKVYNKETSEPIEGAKVVVIEIEAGKTVFEMNEAFEVDVYKNKFQEHLIRYNVREALFSSEKAVATNKMGQTKVKLTETKQYIIAAYKGNFKAGHVSYTAFTSEDPGTIGIGLWPVPKVVVKEEEPPMLQVGSIIVLDQIYYDFGKSYIRTDASKGLDAIVNLMKEYPQMTIDLTSHTDSRGSKEFNLDLSARRSSSAKYYLTSRGIEERRIKAFGKGEQNPRNRCVDGTVCSEEEYQFNRRTEIKITSLGDNLKTIEYIDNPPEYIDRAKLKKRN